MTEPNEAENVPVWSPNTRLWETLTYNDKGALSGRQEGRISQKYGETSEQHMCWLSLSWR